MRHTGYCISGNLVVRMVEADKETRITTGNFFEIPPAMTPMSMVMAELKLILFAPPEDAH